MKTTLRRLVATILNWQVKRLLRRHSIKVVAVAGSIGKTSTKTAIAQLLGATRRVAYQEGNYNADVTIPLVYFNTTLPSLFNPFAWLRLFLRNEAMVRGDYPFDVVVLELGTDGPGQMSQYAAVVHADVGVITAITPEHMEYFGTLDDVANEELALADMCKLLYLNKDHIKPEHFPAVPHRTYGRQEADLTIQNLSLSIHGLQFELDLGQGDRMSIKSTIAAYAAAYSITAAVAVGQELGLSRQEIATGINSIQAAPGRLQLLSGQNSSIIIDDTYNASPEAVKGALETLYSLEAPQKIALLGNMNELGGYSTAAHAEIGALCDPGQLDYVVTLGPDANDALAQAAEKRGCKVQRCASPLEAGEFIISVMQPGVIVLAKGSQNGVYAEEAVKMLLADQSDRPKLVRQSTSWIKRKQAQFPEVSQ